MDYERTGNLIQKLRKEKNMTQVQLAGLITFYSDCYYDHKSDKYYKLNWMEDPFRKMKKEDLTSSYSLKDFFQAVIMGISNPGAIFVIFALFAFFGIQLEPHDFRVAPILLAVSGGSALYWFFFSWTFSRFRKNFKLVTILWINRITGIIVTIIGIALLTEGVMELLFSQG